MSDMLFRFSDGAAYQNTMGEWSRLAGEVFLDWLHPEDGLDWIDIGCGNGAFTQLIADRCAPRSLEGIDPSPGQISYARDRAPGSIARYREGDAQELPFPDNSFDAATSALVIFLVPDRARALAEMKRVVRQGGGIAAYAWEVDRGGFPLEPLVAEMRAMDIAPARPSGDAGSRRETLDALWSNAGLQDTAMREITVERRFANFDDYWASVSSSSFARTIAELEDERQRELKERVQDRLTPDAEGGLVTGARALAIRGRVR